LPRPVNYDPPNQKLYGITEQTWEYSPNKGEDTKQDAQSNEAATRAIDERYEEIKKRESQRMPEHFVGSRSRSKDILDTIKR